METSITRDKMTIVDSKVSYLNLICITQHIIITTYRTIQKESAPTSQPSSERHIYDIESDETDDESSMVELETWYFGNIDSTLARTKCKKDGDFLVRRSTDKQRYIISCRLKDTCHHCIVQVSIIVVMTIFSFKNMYVFCNSN